MDFVLCHCSKLCIVLGQGVYGDDGLMPMMGEDYPSKGFLMTNS